MFVMLLGSFTYAQITDGDYTFEFGCELTHAEKFANYVNAMANTENSKDEFNVIYAADFRVDELPPFILNAADAAISEEDRIGLLQGSDLLVEAENNGIGRKIGSGFTTNSSGTFISAIEARIYIISEGMFGSSTKIEHLIVSDLSPENTTAEQFRDFYLRIIQAKWDLLHP